MELIRENTLLNKLVIVDGIGKCGKSLLLDMISCFPTVEKQEFNSFIEYIALANKYNKISADMAIAILKTEMDTEIYNNMIGRYTNTRLSDYTSVYKYHSPEKYLKRALEENEGSVIYERIEKEKPIYLCWSHDLINKSDIIFEAYGTKLEFIYINRRPIDIIYEMSKTNLSSRMAKDPTEMQYNIKYKDTSVPVIALGWEDEFLDITPEERLIKMIYMYFKLNREELIKKQEYNNLHVINFEELVTHPYDEINKLTNILGNEPLPIINKILHQAKCPRDLNETEYLGRHTDIVKNISKPYVDLLPEINVMYEDIKQISKMRKIENCRVD